MGLPKFRPVADHAVLVEFADAISDEAHAAVLRLDRAIAARPFDGFVEAVPAYVNILVRFDPLVTDHDAVEVGLQGLLSAGAEAVAEGALREVLVCYDAGLAPDLIEVARLTDMTPEAVIAAHLAGEYRVYLYGFAPGYAYLAGVPEPLRLPRKPVARRGVTAGSVIVAGPQCIVTTLTMPTGWWVLGRSPTRILTGDSERPFLFDVGDRVRFRRISRDELERAGRADA